MASEPFDGFGTPVTNEENGVSEAPVEIALEADEKILENGGIKMNNGINQSPLIGQGNQSLGGETSNEHKEQVEELVLSIIKNKSFRKDVDLGMSQSKILDRFTKIFAQLKHEFSDDSLRRDEKFPDKIVLFIGISGAGKSTVIQLLTDNKNTLKSKEVTEGSGEFIIEGSDEISSTTLNSHTLHPKVFVEENIGLCDNPGFVDSRTEIHEILTMYLMKRILEKFKKVKIVLVVGKETVEERVDRSKFTNLLRYTEKFIKNLDKYKNSFYLVTTKVPNVTRIVGGNRVLVEDNTVKLTIKKFLENVEKTFKSDDKEEAKETENCLKIISFIKENIFIIRRPEEDGQLGHTIKFEKDKIKNVLTNSDGFIELHENDFGYSLSNDAKLYIIKVCDEINVYVSKMINVIVSFLTINCKNLNRKDELQCFKDEMENFISKLKDCTCMENFLNYLKTLKISKKLTIENIPFFLSGFQQLEAHFVYLKHVANVYEVKFDRKLWITMFQAVVQCAIENLNYIYAVEDVFTKLIAYDIQNNKSLYNVKDICDWGLAQAENNHAREESLQIDEKNYKEFFKKLNICVNFRFDKHKCEKLNEVIKKAMADSKISVERGVLLCVGYAVRTSEIKNYIEKNQQFPDTIVVFSFHTFYVDEDLLNNLFHGKKVTVIAPIWSIRGERSIELDGKDGRKPESCIGDDSQMDGQNGGEFVGFGIKFINDKHLKISVNGGRGHDGQNGKNGINGKSGESGCLGGEKRSIDWFNLIIYSSNTTRKTLKGTKGVPGTAGTPGTKGGVGGVKGSVKLVRLVKPSTIEPIKNYLGSDGEDGKDGKPGVDGIDGTDGSDVEIEEKEVRLFWIKSDWLGSPEKIVKRSPGKKTEKSKTCTYEENPKSRKLVQKRFLKINFTVDGIKNVMKNISSALNSENEVICLFNSHYKEKFDGFCLDVDVNEFVLKVHELLKDY